jgi:hypothetical protein
MSAHPLVRDITVGAIGAIAGVFASVLTLKGVMVQDQTEQTRLVFEQNTLLNEQLADYRDAEIVWRQEIDAMRGRLARVDADNILLKMKIETTSGSPRGNLIRYLNALDMPAWAKEYDPADDNFKMMHATFEYEQAYCVTADRYRGKTDYEIWPQEFAQSYEEHDFDVLNNKNSVTFDEVVRCCDSGENITRRFHKFYLKLTDGTEVIGGIQITPYDQPVL